VAAQELARHLRLNEGCDFVIAISHLRLAEDIRTANAAAHGVAKVDLILGGHDHEVLHRFHGDTEEDSEIIQQGTKNEEILSNGVVDEVAGDIRIVKSGTNWRGLSVVRLIARRLPDGKATIETVKRKYRSRQLRQSNQLQSSNTSTSRRVQNAAHSQFAPVYAKWQPRSSSVLAA
jgi:UDP-sugar diphosphatase